IYTLVNRIRKNNNLTITNFYDIPKELQITTRGKKFLFFDSGMEDPNRIIVFTTEENLEHFIFSKIVVCDGTFKSSPSNFEQLFTIQCIVRNNNLPLIYCFMKNRSEVCYNNFFTWLESECKGNCKPKSIILDFEVASFNSCKKFFKNSTLYGCLFHLGQIIWRRIQSMKFSKEFKDDYNVKFNVKLILALSFVPESEVLYLAARLKTYLIQEESWDVLKLFEWFQNSYLDFNESNKSINF
ncbi:hypothetical protein DMUE_6175, partial [Dictyocoela muelleri]